MSLQVLTSLYLQGHPSLQCPQPTLDCSHILHVYSWRTSVFLGLRAFANSSPRLCLENTFPPFHLFTNFSWLRIHLRCLYLKAPLPISWPSDYDKCLSSLLPQHSTLCALWTNSSCKWKNKFNITFLLFLPAVSHQQLISFYSPPHSPGSICTRLIAFSDGHRQYQSRAFVLAVSST